MKKKKDYPAPRPRAALERFCFKCGLRAEFYDPRMAQYSCETHNTARPGALKLKLTV
jgi:hypothetical protein